MWSFSKKDNSISSVVIEITGFYNRLIVDIDIFLNSQKLRPLICLEFLVDSGSGKLVSPDLTEPEINLLNESAFGIQLAARYEAF